MKKRMMTVFLLLTCLVGFFGCTSKTPAVLPGSKYAVQSYGDFDGVMLKYQAEYKTHDETYEKESLKGTTKTVEWLGQTYTGEYYRTRDCFFWANPTDKYLVETTPDGFAVDFILDSKTGKLLMFWATYKQYNGQYNGMPEKSEDECREIADAILREVTNDYEDYVFGECDLRSHKEYDSYYFKYYRKVGDLLSLDEISIGINSYGIFQSFYTYYTEQLKDEVLPASYDAKEVEKAIEIKVNDMVKTQKVTEKFSYTVRDEKVMKLNDGTLGILCTLDVTMEGVSVIGGVGPEGETLGVGSATETVQLVVRLEG